MYAVCISAFNDSRHHVRLTHAGLSASGGLTEVAICGADVLSDVEEASSNTLQDGKLCVACRCYLEQLLVS